MTYDGCFVFQVNRNSVHKCIQYLVDASEYRRDYLVRVRNLFYNTNIVLFTIQVSTFCCLIVIIVRVRREFIKSTSFIT